MSNMSVVIAAEQCRREFKARRVQVDFDCLLPSHLKNNPPKHPSQEAFIESRAKRILVRAGRRGGKTVGVAKRAVKRFVQGRRVLYAAPTQEQIDRFWVTVCRLLRPHIDSGRLSKNETKHLIERPGTENRIRAKTAWNADSLRGDYADELILDEWQLMNEDAWGLVGAPMLADNNGNVTFIYTPPSLRSRSASKANDPQHAAKLFKKVSQDTSGRWATFHFGSKENPFISQEAIEELSQDMTSLAYRMEIEAEDIDEAPGALWSREIIERNRVIRAPELERIIVGVDPSVSADGDEAGIITAGKANGSGYVLSDDSVQGSPTTWAEAAVRAYYKFKANLIVAEKNNGGEMVRLTIATVDPTVPVKLVHASRGKQTRAEPVASLYEKNRGHHVGPFESLEDEMCLWLPGDNSPNRMDACVWAFTELKLFRWQKPGPTQEEKVESRMAQGVKLIDIPTIPDPEQQSMAITSNKIWTEQFKREDEEARRGNGRVTFRR